MDWHDFMAETEANLAAFSKEVPQTVKGFGQMGQAAKAEGALSEKTKEYIKGQRVLGASDWRIIALFIAPAVLPPIAFVAVLDVAAIMIFESILGFIGLGIQPPTPTFGNIIADGRKYLINSWWIATMPGVFLLLTLISLNLMGSAMENARNKVLKGAA